MFNVSKVSADWWAHAFGKETTSYTDSTTSTQSIAKNNLKVKTYNHGHLFATAYQTEGRGRNKNTWTSPKKETAFLGSILHKLTSPPQPIASPLFGGAVYKALTKSFSQGAFSIKAPNDIYIQEKKVAGLLLDSLSQGEEHWLIYGLGINVFADPEGLESATSLQQAGLNVDEESWTDFIKELSTELIIASQLALNKELKAESIKMLTSGLKNYPNNRIKTLSPSSDLILDDETTLTWRSL